MKLIDKKGNVSEFDVGDTKVVSLKTKCLMVGEVNPTKKIKFRTTIVKLDAAEGFKIVTDKGTEIPLTSDVDKNISKLKAVGITSSTVANAEAADFYKNEDTNSPATVDVHVNFNFSEVIGPYKTLNAFGITLKYNRKDAPVALKDVIADVVKNEEFKTAYAEFASQLNEYAISGAYKLGDNDKKITVRANSKILQDVELHLNWKKKGESAADSEEFNYTKTPGSIPKIFFHIGHSASLTKENDAEYIKSMLHPSTYNESTYVIVDADGVERYEFGKVTDYYDVENAYESFYPEDIRKATVDKTFVVDCNIDNSVTPDNIAGLLIGNDELRAYLANIEVNEGQHPFDEDNMDRYSILGKYQSIFILSSDLLFADGNSTATGDMLMPWSSASFSAYSDYDSSTLTIENKMDYSASYKGVYIIQKAVDEGRALDLFLDLDYLRSNY